MYSYVVKLLIGITFNVNRSLIFIYTMSYKIVTRNFFVGRSARAPGFQTNNVNNEADLQPQFDIYHRAENHTIQLGATAFLPCIIKNLGNRSVSIKILNLVSLVVHKIIFLSFGIKYFCIILMLFSLYTGFLDT